jgi:hypothetical protein
MEITTHMERSRISSRQKEPAEFWTGESLTMANLNGYQPAIDRDDSTAHWISPKVSQGWRQYAMKLPAMVPGSEICR